MQTNKNKCFKSYQTPENKAEPTTKWEKEAAGAEVCWIWLGRRQTDSVVPLRLLPVEKTGNCGHQHQFWSHIVTQWHTSVTYLVSCSPDQWHQPQQQFYPPFIRSHTQSNIQEMISSEAHALYTLQSKAGGHWLHPYKTAWLWWLTLIYFQHIKYSSLQIWDFLKCIYLNMHQWLDVRPHIYRHLQPLHSSQKVKR